MSPPGWLHFFQRTFPSANMVLIEGSRPVLVDTGFGSDVAETERLLRDAGTPPERLALIVNTHYHCDHAGGNSTLQQRYALPIAAHRWEAGLVNSRDREACSAEWLNQPIEPYQVDWPLADGDVLDTGTVTLQVLHTPGHTLGHISLYAPDEQILICGDTIHRDDVAWLNIFREGAGALQRAMETLERLARLPVRWACSGHGPAIEEPSVAMDAARRRYERWQADPQRWGWHACKRIFTYALMVLDGLPEPAIAPYLLQQSPWFIDYSRFIFEREPTDFVGVLLEEMVRSGAAEWRAGRLVASAPYTPPPPGWPSGPVRPRDWPPPTPGRLLRRRDDAR
jgi:hydroxyacylglutathione hydrolase